MNPKNATMKYLFTLVSVAALLSACNKTPSAVNTEQDEHADHAESEAVEFERGPHNGRVLRDGDFAVEIVIFEKDVPPEFRVYATDNKQPINLAALHLSLELTRFGGVVDQHRFLVKGDYLVSAAEVYEPHSFDVAVIAEYDGHRRRWTYKSYEPAR